MFTVVKRKNLDQVLALIKKRNPQAFFSVEDVKMVSNGVFSRGAKRKFASLATVRKPK